MKCQQLHVPAGFFFTDLTFLTLDPQNRNFVLVAEKNGRRRNERWAKGENFRNLRNLHKVRLSSTGHYAVLVSLSVTWDAVRDSWNVINLIDGCRGTYQLVTFLLYPRLVPLSYSSFLFNN